MNNKSFACRFYIRNFQLQCFYCFSKNFLNNLKQNFGLINTLAIFVTIYAIQSLSCITRIIKTTYWIFLRMCFVGKHVKVRLQIYSGMIKPSLNDGRNGPGIRKYVE